MDESIDLMNDIIDDFNVERTHRIDSTISQTAGVNRLSLTHLESFVTNFSLPANNATNSNNDNPESSM